MNYQIIQELESKGFHRHFKVAGEIINNLGKKKLKILDVGCGEEFVRAYLDDSLEIEYEGLDILNGHTYKINLDKIDSLPIFSNSYDVIICLETFEHLCYPKKIIKELRRVLKDDGIFIGSMPNEYNFYKRLLYLFGIVTIANKPFEVVSEHRHIHNPRVKDIRRFFSERFNILEYRYIWHSRTFKFCFLDYVMNILAPIYPSLFSRIVIAIGNKNELRKM